jgi:hypothetical protein
MDGLAEWHHRGTGGFQLFEDASKAGNGALTLIVKDIEGEHSRLTGSEFETTRIEAADTTRLLQLRDPDNNLVILAAPLRM